MVTLSSFNKGGPTPLLLWLSHVGGYLRGAFPLCRTGEELVARGEIRSMSPAEKPLARSVAVPRREDAAARNTDVLFREDFGVYCKNVHVANACAQRNPSEASLWPEKASHQTTGNFIHRIPYSFEIVRLHYRGHLPTELLGGLHSGGKDVTGVALEDHREE